MTGKFGSILCLLSKVWWKFVYKPFGRFLASVFGQCFWQRFLIAILVAAFIFFKGIFGDCFCQPFLADVLMDVYGAQFPPPVLASQFVTAVVLAGGFGCPFFSSHLRRLFFLPVLTAVLMVFDYCRFRWSHLMTLFDGGFKRPLEKNSEEKNSSKIHYFTQDLWGDLSSPNGGTR